MPRLCLVSHGQPSANPRLVRDASILAEAGYNVRVVTAQIMPNLIAHDASLTDGASWRHDPVGFSHRTNGTPGWNYIRTRRRVASALANVWPSEGLTARAYGYANPELADVAAKEPADLFIAYQQNSLPAAWWAAKRHQARIALDAQDLLADCSAEPVNLVRSMERRYLRHCDYISTMSAAAANRLQDTNNLARTPIVLHNTPRLAEREGIAAPTDRQHSREVSLYWFGQTIGGHSCAEQVLAAMPLLCKSVKLVLRGRSNETFVTRLQNQAESLGLTGQLELLPRAEPDEMVRLASEHDVLLGTQPGTELFNQMAIGNKVFTGMMAGLAVALSDTIAHRELLAEAPGFGFLFRDGDVQSFVDHLNILLADPKRLDEMKLRAWNLAGERFNWEEESKTLLNTIEQVLCRPRPEVVNHDNSRA
jgi:glycosyltransferase involved in cell wall biosynthesis